MFQGRKKKGPEQDRLILTLITERFELEEVHHRSEGGATPSRDNRTQISADCAVTFFPLQSKLFNVSL